MAEIYSQMYSTFYTSRHVNNRLIKAFYLPGMDAENKKWNVRS